MSLEEPETSGQVMERAEAATNRTSAFESERSGVSISMAPASMGALKPACSVVMSMISRQVKTLGSLCFLGSSVEVI
jgi:hypothetical protein